LNSQQTLHTVAQNQLLVSTKHGSLHCQTDCCNRQLSQHWLNCKAFVIRIVYEHIIDKKENKDTCKYYHNILESKIKVDCCYFSAQLIHLTLCLLMNLLFLCWTSFSCASRCPALPWVCIPHRESKCHWLWSKFITFVLILKNKYPNNYSNYYYTSY